MVAEATTTTDIQAPLTRRRLFEGLYESTFPAVAKLVSQRGGSFQDAKDIFQDALVIYCEKITQNKVLVEKTAEAYVFGIARHLWFRKSAQNNETFSLEDTNALSIPDDYFPAVESGRLVRFLEVAGKKCMQLLQAFYYDKLSITDIMNGFGYHTTHSATVQKFKCLEKVRDKVKEKSMHYDDFTE